MADPIRLDLSNRGYREFPMDLVRQHIGDRRLFLNLDNNQIQEIPTEIEEMQFLEVLSMNNNELTSIPDSIGNLSKLAELKLDDNNLTTLPASLFKFENYNLQILSAENNQIESIPNIPISVLENLHTLNLSNNNLTSLPESFGEYTRSPRYPGKLMSLYELRLGNNKLTSLPKSFSSLDRLDTLYIENNDFEEIPDPILNLRELKLLVLYGNKLKHHHLYKLIPILKRNNLVVHVKITQEKGRMQIIKIDTRHAYIFEEQQKEREMHKRGYSEIKHLIPGQRPQRIVEQYLRVHKASPPASPVSPRRPRLAAAENKSTTPSNRKTKKSNTNVKSKTQKGTRRSARLSSKGKK